MNKTLTFDAEMPETPEVTVTLGEEDGDSTYSKVVIKTRAGSWSFEAAGDRLADSQQITIRADGNWEREGLAEALEFAARALRSRL